MTAIPPLARRPPFLIIIAIVATGPVSLHILVPSLPGLQRVFSTDYATVQLTLSLFYIAFAVAQLVYGPVSDRFGRRPVMLAALGLYLAGTLICLTAHAIEVLIAGRIVQAIGGCAGFVVGRAMVRDLHDREKAASVLAYVTMFMVGAPMLAPAVGGYLDIWFGWWAGFVVVLAYGLGVLAAAVFVLHETNFARQSLGGLADLGRSYAQLLRRRVFCGYAFQVGLSSGAFFTFVGGAPYVVVEVMGRPPTEYGLYFIIVTITYMTGNFIAGKASVRLGVDRMIVIGVTVSLAATTALFVLAAEGSLTALLMFTVAGMMTLGSGISQANSLAGAVSVDPQRAGAAAGISGFLQMAFGALGTFVVGALLTGSATPLASVMLAMTALSLAVHFLGVRHSGRGAA